jgi:membrane protease YdiL (CAAX protease family)
MSWMKQHRLVAFFVLAYAIAWAPWPLYAAGVFPVPFIASGPLIAALIVLSVTEGRAGLRDLGARLLRWRVGWGWYAVALGFPLAVIFGSVLVNVALGAPAPALANLAWSSFAMLFALRMVDPTDGPLGEEPGWRGYAVPRLQATQSPLVAVSILGLLVACWHLPLVVTGSLGAVGIATTVAVTVFYVWLFNRTGGSVLLTLIAHVTQGAIKMGDFGFEGTDLARMEWLGLIGWSVIAVGVIAIDRNAWRATPEPAETPVPRGAPALS